MHGLHPLGLPLPEKVAVRVQLHDAAVALLGLAVGNVNIAVLAIDMDTGRREEARRVGVERRAIAGNVRGIELATLADLLNELATVMVVFLYTSARGARDHDFAVIV